MLNMGFAKLSIKFKFNYYNLYRAYKKETKGTLFYKYTYWYSYIVLKLALLYL